MREKDVPEVMGFEFKARTNTSIMYIVGGKEERELEVQMGRVSDTQGASLTQPQPTQLTRSSLSPGARDQRGGQRGGQRLPPHQGRAATQDGGHAQAHHAAEDGPGIQPPGGPPGVPTRQVGGTLAPMHTPTHAHPCTHPCHREHKHADMWNSS